MTEVAEAVAAIARAAEAIAGKVEAMPVVEAAQAKDAAEAIYSLACTLDELGIEEC